MTFLVLLLFTAFFPAKTREKSRHNEIQSFSRIVVNTNLPQLFVVPYCESILSRAYTQITIYIIHVSTLFSSWVMYFYIHNTHVFFGIFSTTSNAISKYDLISIVQGKINKKKEMKRNELRWSTANNSILYSHRLLLLI